MQNTACATFREIASAVLREGTRLSFRAGGRSMTPFISEGSTVLIEPPVGSLRVGDVILFEAKGGQLMLHRIVSKTGLAYITRGDAACHDDGTVPQEAVLGKAVEVRGRSDFHLRFPFNLLLVHALRLRKYPVIFRMLRIPGRLLLDGLSNLNTVFRNNQIDLHPVPCNNNNNEAV